MDYVLLLLVTLHMTRMGLLLLIAYYGNIRISGGGDDGQLEFYDGRWGAVCTDGFDDDAGDVACKQLGYLQSSNVYTYSSK